jgi:DNA polymerase-3 subunit epsilon
MREFVSIDFETANPQRVSACAFGYARVEGGKITESHSYLIKPVGGHAAFQSKIHGIKDEHTFDKPDFGRLYPEVATLFESQLVAHSLFDQQVLRALADHFAIDLSFKYFDTSTLAKKRVPHLQDHKLKTLAKHFDIPKFQHHDAKADAIACAQICLRLHEFEVCEDHPRDNSAMSEFKGMIRGILADDEVNYKEAYELLYWLDDHKQVASRFPALAATVRRVLEDERLDDVEARLLSDCMVIADQELEAGGPPEGAKA